MSWDSLAVLTYLASDFSHRDGQFLSGVATVGRVGGRTDPAWTRLRAIQGAGDNRAAPQKMMALVTLRAGKTRRCTARLVPPGGIGGDVILVPSGTSTLLWTHFLAELITPYPLALDAPLPGFTPSLRPALPMPLLLRDDGSTSHLQVTNFNRVIHLLTDALAGAGPGGTRHPRKPLAAPPFPAAADLAGIHPFTAGRWPACNVL